MTAVHLDNVIHTRMTCLKCNALIEDYSKDVKVLEGSVHLMEVKMKEHLESDCKYPSN